MAATREGGLKAKEKNLAQDPDFYRKIGSKGGRVKRPETRRFYMNRELARGAGARGGAISRRRKRDNS